MRSSSTPRRLDVAAFARVGEHLQGHDLLQNYERVAKDLRAPPADLMLDWQATGERRSAVDGSVRPALHLQVHAVLPLTCQRCMGEVMTAVVVDRHFVFVPDEETAAHLDDESDDDVLVLAPDFNLHQLIEDEVLMALPLVPRHEECPETVRLSARSADIDVDGGENPHPFAALAALKTPKND